MKEFRREKENEKKETMYKALEKEAMLSIHLPDKSLHRYKAICNNRLLHISIQDLLQSTHIPYRKIIFVLLIRSPGF